MKDYPISYLTTCTIKSLKSFYSIMINLYKCFEVDTQFNRTASLISILIKL